MMCLKNIGIGLCLLLLLSFSAFSQVGSSPDTSAQVGSSQSLSDQISSAVKKYPEIKPLLETILNRQSKILVMLKEPQASLIQLLLTADEKTTKLETELASLKNSITKLETDLANERLIALNESIKLNNTETVRNISLAGNAAQLAYSIFATIAYFTK